MPSHFPCVAESLSFLATSAKHSYSYPIFSSRVDQDCGVFTSFVYGRMQAPAPLTGITLASTHLQWAIMPHHFNCRWPYGSDGCFRCHLRSCHTTLFRIHWRIRHMVIWGNMPNKVCPSIHSSLLFYFADVSFVARSPTSAKQFLAQWSRSWGWGC